MSVFLCLDLYLWFWCGWLFSVGFCESCCCFCWCLWCLWYGGYWFWCCYFCCGIVGKVVVLCWVVRFGYLCLDFGYWDCCCVRCVCWWYGLGLWWVCCWCLVGWWRSCLFSGLVSIDYGIVSCGYGLFIGCGFFGCKDWWWLEKLLFWLMEFLICKVLLIWIVVLWG